MLEVAVTAVYVVGDEPRHQQVVCAPLFCVDVPHATELRALLVKVDGEEWPGPKAVPDRFRLMAAVDHLGLLSRSTDRVEVDRHCRMARCHVLGVLASLDARQADAAADLRSDAGEVTKT